MNAKSFKINGQKIDLPQGSVIDTTLTQPGQSADAKVVGDELTGIKEDYSQYQSDISTLKSKKIGWTEVKDGQILFYSDETKANLLATLDLPESDGKVKDVTVNGESVLDEDGNAKIPVIKGNGMIGLPMLSPTYGIQHVGSGISGIYKATKADIDGRTNLYHPITPSDLEYAVTSVVDIETGTSEQVTFVEEKDLEHYVKDTDIASDTVFGIIKTMASRGATVSSSGILQGYARTLEKYKTDADSLIIAKGTLENVLAEYEKKGSLKLINSVTLSEEVKEIEFNTTTDGTAYNFKHVVLKTTFTETPTATVRPFFQIKTNAHGYIDLCASQVCVVDKRTYAVFDGEIRGGRLYTECVTSTNYQDSMVSVLKSNRNIAFTENNQTQTAIKGVKLRLTDSTYLPIGLQISIYGIEA